MKFKKNLKNFLKYFFLFLLVLVLFFVFYFFTGKTSKTENIIWGVNFSQKHAQNLGLDWKEVYLALLNDLKVKRIKIASYWDLIEKERGIYDFDDLDWQIKKAEERGAKILLIIGMKTPRWPECHIPKWAKSLGKKEQQERILMLLEKIVLRYKDRNSIWAWQVENEPFFHFGECPWKIDKEFLKKEIFLVKSKDIKKRPVVISDTGEWSFWLKSAKLGDIVGITIYRRVWSKELKTYFSHFFPPVFYKKRADLVNRFFGKRTICVELQAEPWGTKLLYDISLQEQERTMNLDQFRKNIEFAQKTGLKEFYLWGAEWWYWLKEKENKPEIWNEAKNLFFNVSY